MSEERTPYHAGPSPEKPTIQLRLTGRLGDVLKAETELAKVFTVLERSDFYRNRHGDDFGWLHLTCRVRSEP